MAFFNRDGVWFTVDEDISDAEDLIHRARIDLDRMKDQHPNLNILEYERPGEYRIRSIHGKDEVFITQEYRERKFAKEEEKELELSNLVIAYEITSGYTLIGFYVTATFPAPLTREEGDWPKGIYWFNDDPDLPSYPAYDNDIRWSQLLNPVYYNMDAYPDEWRLELHPLDPIATDKKDKVDENNWNSDSYSDTDWVPGLPEAHGINPWVDSLKDIAYQKTLNGPNPSGTFWWEDNYWDPVCIIGSQDGIHINNTLWEFWWPPRAYGENVSNLAVTAPTVISASSPPFYWFKGRSGFYTKYYDSADLCLEYDSIWTPLCSPCYPEWMWPSNGVQQRWVVDADKDYYEILFTDGPSCWTGELDVDKNTYKYWSGVQEDVSRREYSRSDIGNYTWYYEDWCPAAATWNEEDYGNYEVWGVFVLNYNYDYRCNYIVSPHDAVTSQCSPSPIPFTYQLLFICSHWSGPIVCYEQYLETYDEPEPIGIQCDFWDYQGEPIICFSFKGFEPTDSEDPDYSDDYIQHAIIYNGEIRWSEKMKPTYGTSKPFYPVWRPNGSYLGSCFGYVRPVTLREHIKEVRTMEGV